jgi:mRNA-degrading endonuclease RelE of RelBE toxin-antitoxin system
MRVEVSSQVLDFVRRLPPEPRRRLSAALRGLAREKGDIKRLEAPLDSYCRLRVDGYRVVIHYAPSRVIQCVFAERRSVVYDVFAEVLRDALTGVKP